MVAEKHTDIKTDPRIGATEAIISDEKSFYYKSQLIEVEEGEGEDKSRRTYNAIVLANTIYVSAPRPGEAFDIAQFQLNTPNTAHITKTLLLALSARGDLNSEAVRVMEENRYNPLMYLVYSFGSTSPVQRHSRYKDLPSSISGVTFYCPSTSIIVVKAEVAVHSRRQRFSVTKTFDFDENANTFNNKLKFSVLEEGSKTSGKEWRGGAARRSKIRVSNSDNKRE